MLIAVQDAVQVAVNANARPGSPRSTGVRQVLLGINDQGRQAGGVDGRFRNSVRLKPGGRKVSSGVSVFEMEK